MTTRSKVAEPKKESKSAETKVAETKVAEAGVKGAASPLLLVIPEAKLKFEVQQDADGRIINHAAFGAAMAKFFKTTNGQVTNDNGTKTDVPCLDLVSPALRELLRPIWKMTELYRQGQLIVHSGLFPRLTELDEIASKNHMVKALQLFLYHVNIDSVIALRDMLKDGVVSDAFVPNYFVKGKLLFDKAGSVCFTCTGAEKNHSGNWYISGTTVGVGFDGKMASVAKVFTFPAIVGTIKLSDLPIREPTQQDIEAQSKRGRIYLSKTAGDASAMCYQHHEGMVSYQGHWGRVTQFHKGRVVVSMVDYHRQRPNDAVYNGGRAGKATEYDEKKHLHQLEGVVYGMLLSTKQWVEIQVENLSDIQFDDDAFDKMVMDETEKTTVMKCVTHKPTGKLDLIHGKGAGLMILLSGPPGVGKTLLAEATAEKLRVPLYSVTSGELGGSASQVEARLGTALELASKWNAIMLIDEADVFVTARSTTDIARNEIVCIFLKALEYHSGTVFLTTNLGENIDPAVRSRLQIQRNYREMDLETRTGVWKSLTSELMEGGLAAPLDPPLESKEETKVSTRSRKRKSDDGATLPPVAKKARVEDTKETKQERILDAQTTADIADILGVSMNGREIRNTLYLAKCLAAADKEPLSTKHITQVLKSGMTAKTL